MELEDYWGVGPKTRSTLESSIGTEAAIEAVESGDVWRLVEAGVDRSRATRILRHARSADGMALLATRDSRLVYKGLLESIAAHAVSEAAADRLRTLTPLADRDEMETRLDAVQRGRNGWERLDEDEHRRVLDAFEGGDEPADGRIAAVETAVELGDIGVSEEVFDPIDELDTEALAEAATALKALGENRIEPGADEELDRLRDAREAVDRLSANAEGVLEELRSEGVGDTAAFREGLIEYLRSETTVDPGRAGPRWRRRRSTPPGSSRKRSGRFGAISRRRSRSAPRPSDPSWNPPSRRPATTSIGQATR